MEHEFLLKQQLKEISQIIESNYAKENDIGIIDGISGCAMFQFYYSKYLNIDFHADVGVRIISDCINIKPQCKPWTQ